MGSLKLKTTLVPRGPAAAVVLDEQQVATIGEGAKRFPVVATVNGYSWRTTVTRMGGEFLLGLNHAVRAAAGVEAGDTVDVKIELDQKPREVELPDALADALAGDAEARAGFDRLSYTHRKKYASCGRSVVLVDEEAEAVVALGLAGRGWRRPGSSVRGPERLGPVERQYSRAVQRHPICRSGREYRRPTGE